MRSSPHGRCGSRSAAWYHPAPGWRRGTRPVRCALPRLPRRGSKRGARSDPTGYMGADAVLRGTAPPAVSQTQQALALADLIWAQVDRLACNRRATGVQPVGDTGWSVTESGGRPRTAKGSDLGKRGMWTDDNGPQETDRPLLRIKRLGVRVPPSARMSHRGERPVTCGTCFLIKCVAEQATVSPRAWHRFVVRVTLECDLRACAYSNTWADQPLGWSRPCQHHAASAGCLQRPARPAVGRDRDGVQHRVSALGLRTRQSARWSTIPQASCACHAAHGRQASGCCGPPLLPTRGPGWPAASGS